MFGNRYDEIINAAREGKSILAMNLLDKYGMHPTNTNLIDKSKDTLLHLAARTREYMLAEYLLNKNVSSVVKNIFGETPVDIAIKNHDSRMLELMYRVNNVTNLNSQINKLENKCDELRVNYNTVSRNNTYLSLKNDELGASNKRLRETNEFQEREIKKLKIDNTNLTNDNKTLQTTIITLRNAMKK
jgi:ankyrin repeat protein